MRKLFSDILEFLFPRKCLGCGLPYCFLCEACVLDLPIQQAQVCPNCEKPSPVGALCRGCENSRWQLDGLYVIAPYAKKSLLQSCIQTMKYRHAHELSKTLGNWMARHFPLVAPGLNINSQSPWVVPVALHPKRERERGFNQSRLLAEAFVRQTGHTIQDCLVRHRPTPPQAHRSREERLINLKNSFSLKQNYDLLNKNFILIDDVCSTGATLNECASVLKQNGANRVWGLVLARG